MRDFGNGQFSPMRMAVRQEGETIHAYIAQTDTMEGAVSVLRMNASVGGYPGVHEKFNELVKEIGMGIAEAIIGARPNGVVCEDVPEHERPGNA